MIKDDGMVSVTVEFTEWEIRRGRIKIKKSALDKLIADRDKSELIYLAHDNADIWNSGVDDDATVYIHPSHHHANDTIEVL